MDAEVEIATAGESDAGTHEQHDAVSETVRGWYTASTPELGIRAEPRWFGFFTHAFGAVEARATLTVDDPDQVGPALVESRDLAGGADLQVWIDDRGRARLLAEALAASGFVAVVDTTYLALVGPVAAHPGPGGLVVEEVGDARLGTWAAVKVQGFADRESAAEAEVAAEVAQRRVEAPLARYLLGVLDGEPVAALAHYTGADQLVFGLATRVPWRHRGIGQTLLARWAADGISADCRSLIINATEGSRAEALYRRMGFVDEVYWHRRHEPLPR